jgi:hypothetical protein
MSPELQQICQFLSQAITHFRTTYICIDALDECMDQHKSQLLQSLGGLLSVSTVNRSVRMFLTGRLHIEQFLHNNMLHHGIPISITLRANSEDIRAYITHQLELDQYKEECMNDVLRNEILERIIASSDGMFVPITVPFNLIILLII